MSTDLAIPLDQRFELASADWVREANRFLSERRESIKHFVRPVSFSVEFDKAPEHLDSSGTLGYTIVLDGAETMVIAKPDATVDFFQHCIYDHAIRLQPSFTRTMKTRLAVADASTNICLVIR